MDRVARRPPGEPGARDGTLRPLRIPHVFAIVFGLVVLTALSSLAIPGGSFERDADGRVLAETFEWDHEREEAPSRPRGLGLLLAILEAPLRGIDAAAEVLAFILVLGGVFKILEETGAFEATIRASLSRLEGARVFLVPALMLLFAVGGAVFGMSEEIIPFVLLLVPLVRALGYPPILAVAIPLVGSQVGFAGAMVNPFTIGVAQAIAGLPPLSGWQLRCLLWCATTAVGIGFVMWRIRGLEPEPADEAAESRAGVVEGVSRRQVAVLATLAAGIGVILWGISAFAWYVTEIGAVFLGIGLVGGIVGRLGADRMARRFAEGARELVTAALVVGLARGIVVLAQDLRVLDPVLYASAELLGRLPGFLALVAMFVFQSGLNFFLPSGSGQAALTIPIMAPLADLVGLTRQMAVLAFQLGDGFSNLIVPTSAVLMGSLEAGRVSYDRWFRWTWLLQVWLGLVGIAFLAVAVAIGYGP